MLRNLLRRLTGRRSAAESATGDGLSLARKQFGQAEFQEAADTYGELIASGDTRAIVFFEQSLSLHKAGRAIEAARSCACAYDLDRDMPGMGTTLADLFDGLHADESATLGGQAGDFVERLALANSALALEDNARAREHLEIAHALRPDWPHVSQRLGCLEALAGHLREADVLLRSSAARGMKPDDYMRLDPDFLAGLDPGIDGSDQIRDGMSTRAMQDTELGDSRCVIYAACDAVYFRRFAYPLLHSLGQHAGCGFAFHLHLFNPDRWIAEEVAALPLGRWCRALRVSEEHRSFNTHAEAKTWYSCARLFPLADMLERYRRPVLMVDADVLALAPILPVLDIGAMADAALIRWSAAQWRIWDHFSASAVLLQPTAGGWRFATLLANYVRTFVERPGGAWFLDQIALFAAHAHLAKRGIRFGAIPAAAFSLFRRDGGTPAPGAVFWSVSANHGGNAPAMDTPLFHSHLPATTRRVWGWTLPGLDRFFPEVLQYCPEYAGRRQWEFDLMKICAQHFQAARRRALDIGGHVGFWSTWLAGRFDAVDAFEPHPLLGECFLANVTAKNVHLHAVGLGAVDAKVGIRFNPINSGMTHIDAGAGGDCLIVRLDDFNFTDVDFVKIDTEGFETLVLQGGIETLRRCRPLVLIEEIGAYQARQGCVPGSAGALLLTLGARHIANCGEDNHLYAWR